MLLSCSIEELSAADSCRRELAEVISGEEQAKEAFDPFFARFELRRRHAECADRGDGS